MFYGIVRHYELANDWINMRMCCGLSGRPSISVGFPLTAWPTVHGNIPPTFTTTQHQKNSKTWVVTRFQGRGSFCQFLDNFLEGFLDNI